VVLEDEPPVAELLLADVPPVELPLVLPPVAAPPDGAELAPPRFEGPEVELPSPFPEQATIIVASAAATK
jgi:hypothetical protein